jgi:nucleotide-binding universal stress UspA family protein
MRRILAALDFSTLTAAVVEHAAALARAFDAELALIHVAAPDPDFVGFEVGPQTVRDARAHDLRDAHREIQTLAEGLRGRGVREKALLTEARAFGAETVVIGSHGHGALYDALAGSVCQAVLRGAPCPVLVVPAPRTGS